MPHDDLAGRTVLITGTGGLWQQNALAARTPGLVRPLDDRMDPRLSAHEELCDGKCR